jgi:hypothetical protein
MDAIEAFGLNEVPGFNRDELVNAFLRCNHGKYLGYGNSR